MSDTLIGPFLLGRHLTVSTITGGTADTAGVITWGSALDLKDTIMTLGHSVVKEAQQIAPITTDKMNEVTVRRGNTARVTCLKISNAAQKLHTIMAGFEYAKLTWTEGAEAYIGRFRVGDLESGVDDIGQQTATLNLGPVGLVGADQVTRTVS